MSFLAVFVVPGYVTRYKALFFHTRVYSGMEPGISSVRETALFFHTQVYSGMEPGISSVRETKPFFFMLRYTRVCSRVSPV